MAASRELIGRFETMIEGVLAPGGGSEYHSWREADRHAHQRDPYPRHRSVGVTSALLPQRLERRGRSRCSGQWAERLRKLTGRQHRIEDALAARDRALVAAAAGFDMVLCANSTGWA